MAPLAAQCHFGLGRLLSGGTSRQAKEHLSRAKEMLEGLGLPPSEVLAQWRRGERGRPQSRQRP